MAAIESREYAGEHAVAYTWPAPDAIPTNVWHDFSFLSAWDDERLAHLTECLSAWVERSQAWKAANNLMMRCLSLQNEMSPSRLLAACTWFESIPSSKSRPAISVDHIDAIANSAQEKAEALGYSNLSRRVVGALKRISDESRRDQFARLVQSIKDKFGEKVLDGGIVAHLEAAIGFRGEAAHGHVNIDDDKKYRAFAKAVYAMEALCFFLTVRDLPSTEASVEAMSRNLLLMNYRLSF
jgi:hypothetical protein